MKRKKAENRNSAANNLPPTRQAGSHTVELHVVRRRKTADKGNNFSRTNLIHPRHFNIIARRHIYTHNFSIGNRFLLFLPSVSAELNIVSDRATAERELPDIEIIGSWMFAFFRIWEG